MQRKYELQRREIIKVPTLVISLLYAASLLTNIIYSKVTHDVPQQCYTVQYVALLLLLVVLLCLFGSNFAIKLLYLISPLIQVVAFLMLYALSLLVNHTILFPSSSKFFASQMLFWMPYLIMAPVSLSISYIPSLICSMVCYIYFIVLIG